MKNSHLHSYPHTLILVVFGECYQEDLYSRFTTSENTEVVKVNTNVQI